jgi:cystathionine gamma-lyase
LITAEAFHFEKKAVTSTALFYASEKQKFITLTETMKGFTTKAIHAAQEPDEATGAVVPLLSLATTYKQDGIGKDRGFEYSRAQNPTRQQLEQVLAELEGASYANAFASGLAALGGLMSLFKPNDHIICGDDLYGGSVRYFNQILAPMGVRFTYVNMTDVKNIEAAITPETKLIYFETPTNPMLTLTDLSAVAKIGKQHHILTCVDNTFVSPYLQNPLSFGIDVVLHSSTKYLGGHSDIVGGCLMTNDKNLHDKFFFYQKAAGGVPSPFDCWLLMRSVKTLSLRMDRHCTNAQAVAEFLQASDEIEKVYYPGLKSHPQYSLGQQQMRGSGGIVTIDVGSRERAEAFIGGLNLFTFAESLGCVESLVCYPWAMTHAAVPVEQRLKLGLTEGVLRLSVGVEDVDDLLSDLKAALHSVSEKFSTEKI